VKTLIGFHTSPFFRGYSKKYRQGCALVPLRAPAYPPAYVCRRDWLPCRNVAEGELRGDASPAGIPFHQGVKQGDHSIARQTGVKGGLRPFCGAKRASRALDTCSASDPEAAPPNTRSEDMPPGEGNLSFPHRASTSASPVDWRVEVSRSGREKSVGREVVIRVSGGGGAALQWETEPPHSTREALDLPSEKPLLPESSQPGLNVLP
jgi:hypothetical protein